MPLPCLRAAAHDSRVSTGDRRRERILVEDPDQRWQRLVGNVLDPDCFEVTVCPGPLDLAEGCPLLANHPCPKAEWADTILCGLRLDYPENERLSRRLHELYPGKFLRGRSTALAAAGYLRRLPPPDPEDYDW